jgi:hypothetical protein
VFTHLLVDISKGLFYTSYIGTYTDCGTDVDRSTCQQETYLDSEILEILFDTGELNK